MPIVDAHVHIFPEEIVKDRHRFITRDSWFAQLYSPARARLTSVDDLIESMDSAGIDLSLACGFPWRDQGLCRYHNDYLREAANRYPHRIAWLAIASPAAGTLAAQDFDDAMRGGASGLGEINADAQGFDLEDSAVFASLAELCIQWDLPAMFHVSEPIGHSYPGKGESTPARILSLLSAFPDLRAVAAHWGGGLPFYELMPEVRSATARLAYDSAASTYLYDHRVFETVVSLVGEHRVMFASDYPVLKQAPLLQACRERAWTSDKAVSSILGENAIRIYGLEGKFA